MSTVYDKEVDKEWWVSTAAKVQTTYQGRPVNGVVLTGLYIPFWDLVMLLVKLAFAAIPAMLIIGVVIYGMAGLLAGLGSLRHYIGDRLYSISYFIGEHWYTVQSHHPK